MHIHFEGLRRCGVVLAVVALAACNVGDPGEDEIRLEEAEQELSCTVTRQCPGAAPVSCGATNGLCLSGDSNGGWVFCGQGYTYCAAPCICGGERYVATRGVNHPLRCHAAMETAREQAYAEASAACPAGYCNVVEQELRCEQTPYGDHHALFQLTYSCKDPVTCQ
ncbi:hypothetical protein [Myxococcus xanthus]|uniref:hypothetical protein n=1 Tax=Myxococcus xanthus TaxID=34 RepID=UPI00112DBB4F|nr:hypothetical protein [Myxococcus xanthus]